MTTREASVTAGAFRNDIRYVRFGTGPRPLVVLPGMVLDNDPPGRLTAQAYRYGFRRLAAEHTVYIVARRGGLPAGATGRDLAADHTAALADELGPFRLMGLSSGGFVAQHVALDHPRLVERLVLVVTGGRLSPRGREICLRWRELAELRRLTVPTLVIGGQVDPFFPEPELRATADALPHSTLRIYPDAGHGLPKHQARRLQDDITDFLVAAPEG